MMSHREVTIRQQVTACKMVFKPAWSGTPSAEVYIARRRVNDAFLRDLIRDWEAHGAEVLAQVRREQPGTYMKVMAMLMPKEMKVETGQTTLSNLTDEQLQAMIHELEERIAAKLSGEEAKVINGGAATDLTAFLPPGNGALCDTTCRRKRNPKSTPQRLAYAREYKRQRKAGNPNPAAAARAAAQVAKNNR